jgi:hypothetical protein
MTVAVEIKNHAQLRENLAKLAAAIPGQVPGSSIERTKALDADLWVCTLNNSPFPLSPTVGLSSRWLVIGLTSPSPVMRFLRLQSDSTIAAWKMPKSFGVESTRPKAKLIAAQYSDPRPTMKALTSLLPSITSMVRTAFPTVAVDWTQLPDVDRIVSPLFPSVGTICVDEEGLHISHHSALPLPALGGDGSGLASLIFLGSLSPTFTLGEPAGEARWDPRASSMLAFLRRLQVGDARRQFVRQASEVAAQQ